MTEQLRPEFVPRDVVLTPVAMVAFDAVAKQLAKRLLTCENRQLHKLFGVCGTNMLFVKGAELLLPWVDGVTYLGHDSVAPKLFVPTHTKPNVSTRTFCDAIQKHANQYVLAVCFDPKTVLPVNDTVRLSRDLLERWEAQL